MSICRWAFFSINNHELVSSPPREAMIIGIYFDISVASIWLLIPFLIQIFNLISGNSYAKWINWLSHFIIFAGFFSIIFICIADISYYKYYYNHLGLSVFNWMENPREIGSMLWAEPLFKWSLISIFFSIILFAFFQQGLIWLGKKSSPGNSPIPYLLLGAGFLMGMRGGIQKSSISIRDAHYSEHHFFNQMAISPVFQFYTETLSNSKIYSSMNEMEKEQYLNDLEQQHPKGLKVFGLPQFKTPPNVVFILMESMSHASLKYAPFLDSISKTCIYFDSFYSNGEHTYNGIFSSLYAQPSSMGRHMLRYMEDAKIDGIPGFLKQKGYHTQFQIPCNRNFDNMSAFFWKHHFSAISDIGNMPDSLKMNSVWGTADHFYFKYMLKELSNLSQRKQPFFYTALTISNHSPFRIPLQNFNYHKTAHQNAIAYADWSLKQFFTEASQNKWFENTVFVLVGDHGIHSDTADFPLPLSLHHVPLMIYSPGHIKNSITIHHLGQQTDIAATLLGMIYGTEYNNPFSIDLLTRKRSFVNFCSNNWYGLLNQQELNIMDAFGNTQHFGFNNIEMNKERQPINGDLKNYITFTETIFAEQKKNSIVNE
ncbi:MAG: LTA synthase family protein [Bacteroidia bacterium]|nr:LTA synthase family protein [Bacteroidia bacterium]